MTETAFSHSRPAFRIVLRGFLPGLGLAGLLCVSAPALTEPAITRMTTAPAGLKTVKSHVAGRVAPDAGGKALTYQWPGLYFESGFSGDRVYFNVGRGNVILNVLIDGKPVGTLSKPQEGLYQIAGLTAVPHEVRIEPITESQAGTNVFSGFALPPGGKPAPMARLERQIEFIGDSHTVGYGNTSLKRECTEDEVWSTTDNSQAFGAKVAKHYDADYQINAISGRGIVRNYNGSPGDPLPVAYPFVLFDHSVRYNDAAWHPQIMVIALGTNDFSTPLHAGEQWPTREALHSDYEATYVKFVEDLRAKNPQAFFILWATDLAEGEIKTEVGKVVAQLQAKGEQRIAFIPIDGLTMTGCHWHPSVGDDDTIASLLIRYIDGATMKW